MREGSEPFLTYLPFAPKQLDILFRHIAMLLQQCRLDLTMEVSFELLSPDPQCLRVMASDIQNSIRDQGPFRAPFDASNQLADRG